jgi:phage baseplate assembly protein W
MAEISTTPSQPAREFKSKSIITTRVDTIQPVSPSLFGLSTPLAQVKTVGSLYNTTTQLDTQMLDNFRNMLLTNHGERLILSDFGANLNSLMTERSSRPDWEQQALTQIVATTQKYMPFINIDSIQTADQKPSNNGFARIVVAVNFSIPKLGVQNKRIELTFNTQG